MIPKIIHYCWFGGSPLTEEARKCIESWRKFFPDYEIKEWNESNFNIKICDYVKEAYSKKKWAFVSDYVRFYVLYKYGGIYFDTDVEVIRPIDDILDQGAFMGLESGSLGENGFIQKNIGFYDITNDEFNINPGLGVASNSDLNIFKRIIEEYEKRHFIKANGEIDTLTVVTFVTNILLKEGIKVKNGIGYSCGIYLYPKEYFCPKDYQTGKLCITVNTRTIHHYTATWMSPTQIKGHEIEIDCINKYGFEKGKKIARRKTLLLRIKNKLETLGVKNTIIFVIKKIKSKF